MEAITVQTTVTEAEIYRRGCTVTCRGEAALEVGENLLLVDGLPEGFDETSISLRMPPAVRQGQVRVVYAPLQDQESSDEASQELDRQIDEIDRQIDNHQTSLEAWKSLVRQGSGSQVLELLERLPQMLDKLTSELSVLRAQRRDLSQQRDKQRNQQQRPRLEAHVECDQAAVMPLELTCRTQRAGWKPTYDVLIDQIGGPLKLRMKALMWQKTGTDWHDVTLRLSTGTASVMGDLPRFTPRYLRRYEPMVPPKMSYSMPGASAPRSKARMDPEHTLDFGLSEVSAPQAVVEEQATATTYELQGPQELPSRTDEQVVTVGTQELAASYRLYTYPRRSDRVYLVAHLDEEPSPEVLEQPLAIYLEGSYAGSIRIGRTEDETGYELPLGCDERMKVRRTEDIKRSTKRLSGKVSRDYTCNITVESRRREAAELVILEQVPVSRDKDIEVTLHETSGGTFDAERGELRWNYILEPGYRLNLLTKYTVTHAQNLKIQDDERPSAPAGRTFCIQCGSPLESGLTFCPRCGAIQH